MCYQKQQPKNHTLPPRQTHNNPNLTLETLCPLSLSQQKRNRLTICQPAARWLRWLRSNRSVRSTASARPICPGRLTISTQSFHVSAIRCTRNGRVSYTRRAPCKENKGFGINTNPFLINPQCSTRCRWSTATARRSSRCLSWLSWSRWLSAAATAARSIRSGRTATTTTARPTGTGRPSIAATAAAAARRCRRTARWRSAGRCRCYRCWWRTDSND